MELRICVTLKCNFLCVYCSKDGEGIYSELPELSREEIIELVKRFTRIGVNSVRFTGGEPFCRKDFISIAKDVKAVKGIESVSMVTNGSLLDEDIITEIAEHNIFSYVSISLDTLNKEKFIEITKRNKLDIVIDNIRLMAKKGINLRINFVLTKDNLDEFDKMLDFCIKEKVDLKVLDLYNNKDNFIISERVQQVLSRKQFVFCTERKIPGGFGTPMMEFLGSGIHVIIKDSLLGTTYSEYSCKRCKRYPCQLGVVGPIMTHDGIIKICNLGRERGINCFAANELEELINAFKSVRYERKWYINDCLGGTYISENHK